MNKIAKKFTPKTFTQDQAATLIKAAALGALAWHNGITAPSQDKNCMALINDPEMTIAILGAWNAAWHYANLHAD